MALIPVIKKGTSSPSISRNTDSLIFSNKSEFFASSVGQHGEKTPKGSGDDVLSDFDEPTDEEVGKWSFHQHLVHYLDGETITHSVHKEVELVILVEGGTYVHAKTTFPSAKTTFPSRMTNWTTKNNSIS